MGQETPALDMSLRSSYCPSLSTGLHWAPSLSLGTLTECVLAHKNPSDLQWVAYGCPRRCPYIGFVILSWGQAIEINQAEKNWVREWQNEITVRFTFTFMHLADAFIQSDIQLHSGYTFLISMCVPWESDPQPFALLTQCSNHWATQEHR